MGAKETSYCLPIVKALRDKNIAVELFPDSVKLRKQFSYADKKNIKYVIIVGDEEMKAGEVTLKNMETGEQKRLPKDFEFNF